MISIDSVERFQGWIQNQYAEHCCPFLDQVNVFHGLGDLIIMLCTIMLLPRPVCYGMTKILYHVDVPDEQSLLSIPARYKYINHAVP